ncbi:branched-chain amino acid ABC transporter permease [Ruminococcaceae bacterium OttesenSCG-928-A16]|nr:branched-chain amino acid ABC transporter permease [Ruminococcaceae bacterium OttesenSCG-928-A16]
MNKLLEKKNPAKHIKSFGFLALLLLLPVIFTAVDFTYGITISCFVAIYVIAVSGIDIVFGYCGQISMGHAAFYAVGAYGSALLSSKLNIPIIISMFIAPVIAAILGALLAYPASKLVFHFLSLATIAFGEITYQLILQSPGGITGNAVGLATKKVNLFGFAFNTSFRFYYLALAFVLLLLAAKTNLVSSRVGRAFVAIRENTHAAEGMGVNARKYKVIAFATSAFFTAVAGSMYAHFVGYISPDTFTNKQSVLFITMLLFGGTASKPGPIIGAIAVLLLNEALRSMENMQMLVYGFLLLIVILLLPGGIFGMIKDLFYKYTHRGGKENAKS